MTTDIEAPVETHVTASSAHAAAPACDTCGGPIRQRTRHAKRFCSNPCRNAFHGAERRKDAIRAKAVELYQALRLLHDNLAEYQRINNLGGYDNHDMRMARAAMDGLKPPVEPKDLLKAKEPAPA